MISLRLTRLPHRLKKCGLAATFALGASLHSVACGPDFQVMVTTCGTPCLRSITTRWFWTELNEEFPGRLAEKLPDDQDLYDGAKPSSSATTRSIGLQGLSEAQGRQLLRALDATTHQAAYARGAGLAAAVRLYAAGAVAFHEKTPASREAAIAYFRRVVAMPPELSGNRRLWAQYSLARALHLRSIAAAESRAARQAMPVPVPERLAFLADKRPLVSFSPSDPDHAEAKALFEAVLRRLDENIADPLDLRSGAYGELGRLALEENHLAEATRWYFRQGSVADAEGAAESLRMVAEKATTLSSAAVRAEIQDADFQRLLALYLLDRVSRNSWVRDSDLSSTDPDYEQIVDALRGMDPKTLPARERYGALVLRFGEYELARRLLQAPETPFGHWAAAKLALYQGRLDDAAAHFAAASKAFPLAPTATDTTDYQRRAFHADWAVATLTRGDYSEALTQLDRLVPPLGEYLETRESGWNKNFQWHHTDWGMHRRDVAWLAERVMTSEEVRHHVDTHPDASWLVRSILSRRLVREGLLDAAVRYASTPKDAERIRRYTAALETSLDAKLPLVQRARAAVAAAVIASNEGMELRGTDLDPDAAFVDGGYAFGPHQPSDIAPVAERKRAKDSAVKPAVRFHYRLVAAQDLIAFSRQLPAHSQLVTSVLCAGAGIAKEGPRDQPAIQRLFFQEYQRRGRLLHTPGFDRNFGAECPEI